MSPKPVDKARANTLAEITPLCPATWDFKPGLAPLKQLSKTTVFMEYTELTRLEEAGPGHIRCGFDLAVVPALEDTTKAEDAVDAAVVDLLLALDGHEWIKWIRGEKKAIGEQYIGWVISITSIASLSKTEPEGE